MALSVDTTPAKHVTVLRNGDGKYEGRKFIISRRRYRTFDSLLSDITHQIGAPFGAVRRLYTPKGSRQIRGIDDLEGGGTYVAGGTERFKKIEYSPMQQPGKNWGFSSRFKPGFLADDPPPLILPKKNRKYAQRSAQFHKVRQPVQFTVYRNGLPADKGSRFLLKSREMKSFETVLTIISFKIRLVEGAVRKLYTTDGSLLTEPGEITDGGHYVACGSRRFMPGVYGDPHQPAKLQKLPAIKRNRLNAQQSPRTQSNPLPAIEKKTAMKKARSEKDSPVPISEDKEDRESTIPDMVTEEDAEAAPAEPSTVPSQTQLPDTENIAVLADVMDDPVENGDRESTIPDMMTEEGENEDISRTEEGENEDISRTEVSTVPSKDKLPVVKKSNQAISPEAMNNVPRTQSKVSTKSTKSKRSTKASKENLVTDDGLFNATGAVEPSQDGNFLMNNTHEDASRLENGDEIDEDNDLVEDKPINLQQAEEVEEDEISNQPIPKKTSRAK